MHVAAIRAELLIRDAHSLKEKRRVVKRVVDSLHRRHAVAAAEVDNHDMWQRATIGIAAVAAQSGHVERLLHQVVRSLDADRSFELLATDTWRVEEQ